MAFHVSTPPVSRQSCSLVRSHAAKANACLACHSRVLLAVYAVSHQRGAGGVVQIARCINFDLSPAGNGKPPAGKVRARAFAVRTCWAAGLDVDSECCLCKLIFRSLGQRWGRDLCGPLNFGAFFNGSKEKAFSNSGIDFVRKTTLRPKPLAMNRSAQGLGRQERSEPPW